MLKAFMDESGTHDGSPVLTVGAYIARPRQWQDWTKKWNAKKHPIKVYHATDAASRHGEFEGWSKEDVTALWLKLLSVILDADFPGIVIGIHMESFEQAMSDRPDLRKIFGTPYTACFHWVTQILLNIQAEHGSSERIGFIHECNDYRHEALDAFSWIKKYGNPQGSMISLQFGEKATHTPLQAADILAFEGNKRLRDPSQPERRSWSALSSKGAIILGHYGRENMGELLFRLDKLKEGKVNEIDLGFGWNRARGPWEEK